MRRRHIDEILTKTDSTILSYLTPCTDEQLIKFGSDSYFCFASKHLRRDCLASRVNKVKTWTEKNGGTFKLLSEKMEDANKWYYEIHGDNHGLFVQIRFPRSTKRDMKEIMSTLYDPSDTVYV